MCPFFLLPTALLALIVHAQYPPPASYQNILKSPLNSEITISYKQPPQGTCTTAFPTQKQYTGYIGLPPFTLVPIQQNYSINTFFWFVEARQLPETAPLTIWLNGGPGSSSMIGFFNEMGPCNVVQMSDGSFGTATSAWGWDRASNVLFIDQPAQVGFSYDEPTNATIDFLTGLFEPQGRIPSGIPPIFRQEGTFSSSNANSPLPIYATANTTQIAARATWHFLQSWLSAFPQYNPGRLVNSSSASTAGIHLFAESYGGHYGPAFASFFDQQNLARTNGTIPSNSSIAIQLESLGILNGLVDDLVQDYYYPYFAYNNTYGIQAISQTDELNGLSLYSGENGCISQINACRAALSSTDPNGDGDVDYANTICEAAQWECNNLTIPYINAGYSVYDVRQKVPSPALPAAYQEYLNTASVLSAIGAPVNYTEGNPLVANAFLSTGDTIRGGQMQELADLLQQGIRVALIYGDADFICNWLGGEAVSLQVAGLLPHYPAQTSALLPPNPDTASTAPAPAYASGFPAAGYADIVVNGSYIGGAVRQYGNLSFSRIYDAGHTIPFYQPETAFTVFARVVLGTDISTGQPINLSTFGSSGPLNATHTNDPPSTTPAPTCWLRAWNATCSPADLAAVDAGAGTIVAGVFYADPSSVSLPPTSVAGGVPGSPMSSSSSASSRNSAGKTSSTVPLTGVYTATATPKTSSARAARNSPGNGWLPLGICAVVASAVAVAVGALLPR